MLSGSPGKVEVSNFDLSVMTQIVLGWNLSRTFWSTINSAIRHKDHLVFWKIFFKRWFSILHQLAQTFPLNKMVKDFSGGPHCHVAIAEHCDVMWDVITAGIVIRWVVGWAGLRSVGCLSFFCRENQRKNAESRFNVSIIPMWQFYEQFFICPLTQAMFSPSHLRVSGINQEK